MEGSRAAAVRKLDVEHDFECSRMEQALLAQAYQKVVPAVRRRIRGRETQMHATPINPAVRMRPQRGYEQSQRDYSIYSVPEDEQERIPVPAIVSEDLFETVQQQLVENKERNRQRRRGARYLLQGLLKCQCCGYAYYGKPVSRSAAKGKKRNYAYYRCIGTDTYRFGGKRICWNKQVRTDLLEAAVWEDVCALLRNPHRIRQEYQRRLNEEPNEQVAETEQLSTMIQKIKRGIARLIDAYEDGLFARLLEA